MIPEGITLNRNLIGPHAAAASLFASHQTSDAGLHMAVNSIETADRAQNSSLISSIGDGCPLREGRALGMFLGHAIAMRSSAIAAGLLGQPETATTV